jgi:signal peptidase II
MNLFTRVILIIFCISCLVGCDITTKQIAQNQLKGQPLQAYLGNVVQLIYVENPGGMLSFGYNLSGGLRFIIFQVFISVVLILLFIYILFKKDLKTFQTAAFILFMSGGIGNLIDRFTNDGKVIDFIILRANGLHTGVFNIADFYITTGVAILIIFNFIPTKSPAKDIRE